MARMAHGPDRRGPGTHLPRRGAFAGATRDGGSRRSFLRESLGGSLAAGAAAFAAPAIRAASVTIRASRTLWVSGFSQ